MPTYKTIPTPIKVFKNVLKQNSTEIISAIKYIENIDQYVAYHPHNNAYISFADITEAAKRIILDCGNQGADILFGRLPKLKLWFLGDGNVENQIATISNRTFFVHFSIAAQGQCTDILDIFVKHPRIATLIHSATLDSKKAFFEKLFSLKAINSFHLAWLSSYLTNEERGEIIKYLHQRFIDEQYHSKYVALIYFNFYLDKVAPVPTNDIKLQNQLEDLKRFLSNKNIVIKGALDCIKLRLKQGHPGIWNHIGTHADAKSYISFEEITNYLKHLIYSGDNSEAIEFLFSKVKGLEAWFLGYGARSNNLLIDDKTFIMGHILIAAKGASLELLDILLDNPRMPTALLSLEPHDRKQFFDLLLSFPAVKLRHLMLLIPVLSQMEKQGLILKKLKSCFVENLVIHDSIDTVSEILNLARNSIWNFISTEPDMLRYISFEQIVDYIQKALFSENSSRGAEMVLRKYPTIKAWFLEGNAIDNLKLDNVRFLEIFLRAAQSNYQQSLDILINSKKMKQIIATMPNLQLSQLWNILEEISSFRHKHWGILFSYRLQNSMDYDLEPAAKRSKTAELPPGACHFFRRQEQVVQTTTVESFYMDRTQAHQ